MSYSIECTVQGHTDYRKQQLDERALDPPNIPPLHTQHQFSQEETNTGPVPPNSVPSVFCPILLQDVINRRRHDRERALETLLWRNDILTHAVQELTSGEPHPPNSIRRVFSSVQLQEIADRKRQHREGILEPLLRASNQITYA